MSVGSGIDANFWGESNIFYTKNMFFFGYRVEDGQIKKNWVEVGEIFPLFPPSVLSKLKFLTPMVDFAPQPHWPMLLAKLGLWVEEYLQLEKTATVIRYEGRWQQNSAMYVQSNTVVHSLNHSSFHLYCCLLLCSCHQCQTVVTGKRQSVPFSLLLNYQIFRTALYATNNIRPSYKVSHVVVRF